jgi:siroheme synthase
MTASASGSLIVVGTGISAVTQTTLESVAAIESADILYYSVVDPTTEHWLRQLQPNAVSFTSLYGLTKDRRETYREMTQAMVGSVREGSRVCAAFYGHPGVFAEPTHRAIAILREEGYSARMLPGVSADACFYADAGINPGAVGMQSFEATEFLLFDRCFDPTSGLLLWQIGVLGQNGAAAQHRPERLARMATSLARYYPLTHGVLLYYAATFPGQSPMLREFPLAQLPEQRVPPMSMLYVPPLPPRAAAADILGWFSES